MEHITTIWEKFNQELTHYIAKKVKDRNDVDDILQDSFLRIIANMENINNARKLKSYLYGIVHNTIMDFYRKEKRKQQKDIQIENHLLAQQEEVEVERELGDIIQLCCIEPFMEQLPPKYRQAIQLTLFEGLSQKQLAKQLKISYSGAKSRVQRGRDRLKEMITGCCCQTVKKRPLKEPCHCA